MKGIVTAFVPDQTCCVPGRFIGEKVAFLRFVVEMANEYNLPVALLSLGQEPFQAFPWGASRLSLVPPSVCSLHGSAVC